MGNIYTDVKDSKEVLLSCNTLYCPMMSCTDTPSSRIEELFPDFPISPKNQR